MSTISLKRDGKDNEYEEFDLFPASVQLKEDKNIRFQRN